MKTLLAVLFLLLTVAACATSGSNAPPSAVANLQPTKGSKVWGEVTFTQKGDQVLVVANVHGLTPGLHGFHVHEKGDCSAPDAMSAGGHFNPSGKPHGAPDSAEHHGGDLGNLSADGSGNATLSIEAGNITLDQSVNSVVGKSVIVHANPDDLKSQPAGNAGPRVACGIIQIVKQAKSRYSGY